MQKDLTHLGKYLLSDPDEGCVPASCILHPLVHPFDCQLTQSSIFSASDSAGVLSDAGGDQDPESSFDVISKDEVEPPRSPAPGILQDADFTRPVGIQASGAFRPMST